MRTYKRQSLAERFWPKVDKGAVEDCWDWLGARTGTRDATHKYGYLGRTPASTLGPFVPPMVASRASWVIHFGPIPDGMDVLHRCDRPICVNPAHLFLGTQADNNRDRIGKGRNGQHYLAKNGGNCKLTIEQVKEIRARYAAGGKRNSQTSLAAEYGVKQPQISRIVRGVTWV